MEEKIIQAKDVKNKKTGGKRTLRTCSNEECNIKTRGIWRFKGKLYCYKCYITKVKILNSPNKSEINKENP